MFSNYRFIQEEHTLPLASVCRQRLIAPTRIAAVYKAVLDTIEDKPIARDILWSILKAEDGTVLATATDNGGLYAQLVQKPGAKPTITIGQKYLIEHHSPALGSSSVQLF